MSSIDVIGLITAAVSSGSLITLIIFLVQRRDNRKNEFETVQKRIDSLEETVNKRMDKLDKDRDKVERDLLRIQILQMMDGYENEDERDLLEAAKRYFVDLHGDWVLTSSFNRFLQKKHIARPEWFRDED